MQSTSIPGLFNICMVVFVRLMTHTAGDIAFTEAGVWERGAPLLVALGSTALILRREHTHTHAQTEMTYSTLKIKYNQV